MARKVNHEAFKTKKKVDPPSTTRSPQVTIGDLKVPDFPDFPDRRAPCHILKSRDWKCIVVWTTARVMPQNMPDIRVVRAINLGAAGPKWSEDPKIPKSQSLENLPRCPFLGGHHDLHRIH
jgi:hypothetical protein